MRLLRRRLERCFSTLLDLIADAVNQASLLTIYSFLILSSSVFIYISIYMIYVPIVKQTRPVYLQFDSKCLKPNCLHPYANIDFTDVRSTFHLNRGQSYKFELELAMPECDINWDQGMFMIRLRLIESQGKTLFDSTRPAILRYRTLVTRTLKALAFSPFFITNYKNEMQTLNVQLIDNYIEGARFYFKKMDRAFVEILARDIQVYWARLHIVANLSGLTYYMYHWPLTSGFFGVATLAGFMSMVGMYQSRTGFHLGDYGGVDKIDTTEESGSDDEPDSTRHNDENRDDESNISNHSKFTGDLEDEDENEKLVYKE